MSVAEYAADHLGVVIVNYFRITQVVNLVKDLVESHGVDPAVIAIVNNGDETDAVAAARAEFAPGVRILDLPNPGYAAAANHGYRVLGSPPLLLVLTHDVSLQAGAIDALIDSMLADAQVGAIGPLILDGRRPEVIWSAGGMRSRWRTMPSHLSQGSPRSQAPAGVRDVPWIDGAIVLARGEAVRDVGGISEGYFLYMEDVDFGARLRRAGWKVVCASDSVATQVPGDTRTVFVSVRNFTRLLIAERNWFALALFLIETCLRLLLGWIKPYGVLARARERSGGLWHAFVDTPYPRAMPRKMGPIA